jgi:hypothetical protein
MTSAKPAALVDRVSIEALEARIAELEAENAALRPYAPCRPPAGWLVVKAAAPIAGLSASGVYKQVRRGALRATKLRGRIFIDGGQFRS